MCDERDWHSEAEDFEKALKKHPNNAQIHKDYAFFLFLKSKRYSEAEEHFKKALELEPSAVDVYYNYGVLLLEMGRERYPEAEKHFKKALEIDQNNASAWSILGFLYLKIGRLEDGVDCLIKSFPFWEQLPDKGSTIFLMLPALAEKLAGKFSNQTQVSGSDGEKCEACFRIALLYKIWKYEEKVKYWCKQAKKYCESSPELKQKLDTICSCNK